MIAHSLNPSRFVLDNKPSRTLVMQAISDKEEIRILKDILMQRAQQVIAEQPEREMLYARLREQATRIDEQAVQIEQLTIAVAALTAENQQLRVELQQLKSENIQLKSENIQLKAGR